MHHLHAHNVTPGTTNLRVETLLVWHALSAHFLLVMEMSSVLRVPWPWRLLISLDTQTPRWALIRPPFPTVRVQQACILPTEGRIQYARIV